MPDTSGSGIERRRHKRYRVKGKVEFWVDAELMSGELLDVGSGGILIRTNKIPNRGAMRLEYTVDGYPEAFKGSGLIVRTQLNVLAVMFVDEPANLLGLLQWLEQKEQATEVR